MTYREIFKEFLEEQGVYSRYMELAEKHLDTYRTLDEMFNQKTPSGWISGVFVFSMTDEGAEYWWGIHDKWLEVIQDHKK